MVRVWKNVRWLGRHTAGGIAQLGARAASIARFRDDSSARSVAQTFAPSAPASTTGPAGQQRTLARPAAWILVSPGMPAHDVHLPGASVGLEPKTFDSGACGPGQKVLYLEGYLWGTAKAAAQPSFAAAEVIAPAVVPVALSLLGCFLRRSATVRSL